MLFTTMVALLVNMAFRWRPIDGIEGAILSLFLREDTVWAEGYTNDRFRAVRIGMKRDEVYSLLGPPLYQWHNASGEVVEWWTHSPDDTHFRQRAIVFQGDRARRKIARFWVD